MDKQPTHRNKRQKRHRRKKQIIIGSIAVIFVLLGLIAWLMLKDKGASTPTVSAEPTAQLTIDPNAGAQITPTSVPQEPGVAIPGWGSMTIPAGVTEVTTSMQNPEANEGWYYLTFELRLKDTDEVIFTTGLIPPGQYCNKVTLTRSLEKGEYAAIIHVQPYRISDQSPTNNADMETVLIVE